jgi:hypothetical protein
MKKYLSILPVLILFILIILQSCNDNSDPLHGCNGFGFLRVVNNSWNIYQIVIDNDSVHFCAEVYPKNTQMCDVYRGRHNIKVGYPGHWVCEQEITAYECQEVSVYCTDSTIVLHPLK